MLHGALFLSHKIWCFILLGVDFFKQIMKVLLVIFLYFWWGPFGQICKDWLSQSAFLILNLLQHNFGPHAVFKLGIPAEEITLFLFAHLLLVFLNLFQVTLISQFFFTEGHFQL